MARQRRTTAERDTLMAAVATEGSAAPLWTQPQVDQLITECNKVLAFMAKRGAAVNIDVLDVRALRQRCFTWAANSVLVKKGICTEAELNGEVFSHMLNLLPVILQAFEEQTLQQAQQAGGIEPVRKPNLLVVKH